ARRHGGQCDARPAAIARAGRPGGQGEEGEGSEKRMIATLAEAALRSFVLGGVVWFGLYLFRVRNPHVHMTAWVVVLLASLAMPFVMHWPTLTIARPSLPLPVPMPDDLWPADLSMLEAPQPASPIGPGVSAAVPARGVASIDRGLVVAIVYAGV